MHISVTLRICPGTLSSKVTDRDLCHRNEKEKGKSQPHRVTYLGTFSLMIYVLRMLHIGAFGGYLPAFSVSERCPGNIVEKTWAR
jgi:hypothetical protein